MSRRLETIYTIRQCSYIPEHNRPVVWQEVWAGHNPRDYAASDYRPMQRLIGKYRSVSEAMEAVRKLKGNV